MSEAKPNLTKENLSAEWHRVADLDQVPEGRVIIVTVGRRVFALTHYNGRYGFLDNRCPHQGGPLGEGSIEKGWLRCPWHGDDYNPLDGSPPPGFSDAPTCYPTETRADGVYVALTPEQPRERTVADVVVETMVNWGVDAVFGMVGHSNLGLADAFRVAEERGDLRYFGIRHEGAASFAATAYGKLTGRLAACFGIAGPGSTNLLTGLYNAKTDRAPVLALSGQVPSKTRGRGAFQDADLMSASKDVTRYSQTVQVGSNHAELMNLACKTALVERDVAHLVFPDEVQVFPAGHAPAGSPKGRLGDRAVSPPPAVLTEAVERIAASARPLFIIGSGARFDMKGIIELAEAIGAPMATTFKAKGVISDRHPLGCGVLGRSGTPIASWFMNEADLLVVFGASFSDHTGIAPYKPIIQIYSDPSALGRFHAVAVPMLADVGVAARAIKAAIPETRRCIDHRAEVTERWAIWRAEKESRRTDDRGRGVSSAAIFDVLTDCIPLRRRDVCRRGQQHLFVWPLFRGHRAGRAHVRIPGIDRLRVSSRDGCLGRRGQATSHRLDQQRRWLWSIRHGAHDCREVRHEPHPHPAQQRRARKDLQGAAGCQLRRVADLARQSRLRRLRGVVRSPRLSSDRSRPVE